MNDDTILRDNLYIYKGPHRLNGNWWGRCAVETVEDMQNALLRIRGMTL